MPWRSRHAYSASTAPKRSTRNRVEERLEEQTELVADRVLHREVDPRLEDHGFGRVAIHAAVPAAQAIDELREVVALTKLRERFVRVERVRRVEEQRQETFGEHRVGVALERDEVFRRDVAAFREARELGVEARTAGAGVVPDAVVPGVAFHRAVAREAEGVVVRGRDPAALPAARRGQARAVEERSRPRGVRIFPVDQHPAPWRAAGRAAIGHERTRSVGETARVRDHEVEGTELHRVDRRVRFVEVARGVERVEGVRLDRRLQAGPTKEDPPSGAGDRQRREVLRQDDADARHVDDLDLLRRLSADVHHLGARDRGMPGAGELDREAALGAHAHLHQIHPVRIRGRCGPRDVAVVAELHRGRAHEREARHVERAVVATAGEASG